MRSEPDDHNILQVGIQPVKTGSRDQVKIPLRDTQLKQLTQL